MGRYAKIFLPCFIFSSSSFFSNLHSLFPVPFYCFLLIFPFVLHFSSIWKTRFKNRVVTRRSALLLSVEGKTYKTMNPNVPIKEMLRTHLHPMTPANGKKQVGIPPNREPPCALRTLVVTPVATTLPLYYPAFLSAWLGHRTKSSCQGLSAMAPFSVSTILYLIYFHNSPLFHSTISLLCRWH